MPSAVSQDVRGTQLGFSITLPQAPPRALSSYRPCTKLLVWEESKLCSAGVPPTPPQPLLLGGPRHRQEGERTQCSCWGSSSGGAGSSAAHGARKLLDLVRPRYIAGAGRPRRSHCFEDWNLGRTLRGVVQTALCPGWGPSGAIPVSVPDAQCWHLVWGCRRAAGTLRTRSAVSRWPPTGSPREPARAPWAVGAVGALPGLSPLCPRPPLPQACIGGMSSTSAGQTAPAPGLACMPPGPCR